MRAPFQTRTAAGMPVERRSRRRPAVVLDLKKTGCQCVAHGDLSVLLKNYAKWKRNQTADTSVSAFPRNVVGPDRVGLRIFHDRRTHMKWIMAAACGAAISLAFAPVADAKGCIKGAIVGGAAGHMAGHGKLGAAAGCVVGHHEANKKDPNNANAQDTSKQK